MNEVSREILFEKFEIIECLKKDAQAAVYLADHIYLGKKIILKSLDTKKIFDDSVIDRFKREAKLLAKLDHPHIIKVLDFGMYGDFFYISFEYFESKNLREFLKGRSLTIEEKEKLFIQILLGLRFAHSNKIVHRDIKPENVLVDDSLNLKISDFGLALIQDDSFETSKYSIVGTPCYMSPEQVNGAKLTIQSDLFSVGSLAYELFTEKNLFLGNDVAQTINNVINFNSGSVDAQVENLPENIKTVIKKLLKKSLNERIKNVDDVLEYFNVDLSQTNTVSIPIINEKRSSKKKPIIFSSAAALIVLLLVISFNLGGNSEQNQNNQPIISENSNNNDSTDSVSLNESVALIDHAEKDPKVTSKTNDIKNISEKNNTPNPPTLMEYGKLSVECLPWADVYINDRKIDTTPIDSLLTFSTGEYSIRLVHPDYPEYNNVIKIENNKTTSVKIHLETLVGFFKCNVFPWGEIYIDNRFIGQTPLKNLIQLQNGSHNIRIKNPNFEDYRDTFSIERQDTVEINFNFSDRKFSIAENN